MMADILNKTKFCLAFRTDGSVGHDAVSLMVYRHVKIFSVNLFFCFNGSIDNIVSRTSFSLFER